MSSWRRTQRWLAVVTIAMTVFLQVVLVRGVIPPAIITAIALGVGVWLLRRPGKAGPVVLGLATLLWTVMSIVFGASLQALPHPESSVEFVFDALVFIVFGCMVVATSKALRGADDAHGPRLLGLVSGSMLGVLVVTAVFAGLAVSDDPHLAGDLVLVAKDYKYSQTQLSAKAGSVAVFIENKDLSRHTFTVNGLADQELPVGSKQRVLMTLKPGSYEFYCAVPGHKADMHGTITVT